MTADSTATQVAFQLDNEPGSTISDVVSGTATYQWPSWGYANGTHTVTAFDCDNGECNTTGTTSDPFTLTNTAPQLTAPAGGTEIAQTGFSLTAASDGVAVQFLIDRAPAGSATAADSFTTTYSGAALTEGVHTINAVQCNADASQCNGPESDQVNVTVVTLHPQISTIAPNPFGPNGNGIKDRTTVTYGLSHNGSADFAVVNSAGTTVRGKHFDSESAGTHSWVWDGKNNGGTRVPDGTYRVELDTSADIGGVMVQGTASRSVRVDSTAPSLSSVTGGGTTFYPYRDKYKDTFTPAVTLGERGTLKLVVKNPAGHTVRTITARKYPGRRSLSWNGRNSANRIVAAGKYHWTFTATDATGNTRTTTSHLVYVSAKRLVLKQKVITHDGSGYVAADHTGCGASVSKASSTFASGGVLLRSTCRARQGVALTEYGFRLPTAIRYQRMNVQTYGYSHRGYAVMLGLVYSTANQDWDFASRGAVEVTSSTTGWRSLGGVAARGHYTSRRMAYVIFAMSNRPQKPANFDLRHIRLTIGCYVLQ